MLRASCIRSTNTEVVVDTFNSLNSGGIWRLIGTNLQVTRQGPHPGQSLRSWDTGEMREKTNPAERTVMVYATGRAIIHFPDSGGNEGCN